MPRPKKSETYQEYINRAVQYMIRKEGLKPAHARAKAEGMWKQHKRGRND